MPSAKSFAVLAATASVMAVGGAAASDRVPTLGRQWAPAQHGYGHVKPAKIDNGGDPTGLVWNVRWSHWGRSRAIGRGVGYFLWPGLGVSDGTFAARAIVVAYDLGSCRDKFSYRRIAWYFPRYGGTFVPEESFDICSGDSGPGRQTHHCGRIAVRSPAGIARKIEVSGLTCPRARRLIAGSPSVRYVERGGRFRYAGLFCGSEGKRVAGLPATFECARGRVDIFFDVVHAPAVPVFLGCSKIPKVRPTSIMVACGDGNFFLTGLKWSQWNDARADATGVGHQNDCRPNCADGHFHRYSVAVRLFRPETCSDGRRQFTRFAFRFVSRKPPGVARAGTLKSPFYRGVGCP